MQVVFFAYVDFVFTLFMQYANFYPYFYYFNKDGKIVNDVAAEGMIAIVRAIGLMK